MNFVSRESQCFPIPCEDKEGVRREDHYFSRGASEFFCAIIFFSKVICYIAKQNKSKF